MGNFLKAKIYPVLILLLLIFSFVFLYFEAVLELIERWEDQEEYSHGFIIPFVSLFFIWKKKQLLHAIKFKAAWSGFILVILGLIVLIVGKISVLYILIDYSLIFVLIGLIWSVIGWAALKKIIVPLLMLAFAIPLPYYIDILLSSKLQLLSSRLGVEFIIWCKIPVYLEGNIIDLGDFKLQVVEACSGLRYLFPLMSIGFICAYLFNTVLWKRMLVFFSCIPITILMNSFRIGMVGLLVNQWGIELAEGFLHDFEGWAVFMASLVLLMIEMLLLAKLGNNSLVEVFGIKEGTPDNFMSVRNKSRFPLLSQCQFGLPFYCSCLSLLIVSALIFNLTKREEVIPQRQSFNSFPMNINSWHGQRLQLDQSTITNLSLTDYISTNYRNNAGKLVNFYVAYYESQRRNVVPHSPKVCIPGGGWEIAEISRTSINGSPATKMLIKKGYDMGLVYYWYQQHGQLIANEYSMKWLLFKDTLFYNRSDGALVRLHTKIYNGEKVADAEKRLKKLSLDIVPFLGKYIPD